MMNCKAEANEVDRPVGFSSEVMGGSNAPPAYYGVPPQPGYVAQPLSGYAAQPQPVYAGTNQAVYVNPTINDTQTTVLIASDSGLPGGTNGDFIFNDKAIRQGFIRKVYGILTLQLLVTFGVISIFTLV